MQSKYYEPLKINATDYVTNSPDWITGYTGNPGSPGSSDDLFTKGAIMTPDDQAPEPNKPDKQNIGISEYLYQGDGYRAKSPAPKAMGRLTLKVAGGGEMKWNQLRVESSAAADAAPLQRW